MTSPGCRRMPSTMAVMSGRGVKILAGAAPDVLGVISSTMSWRSFAGSWILFWAFRKISPRIPPASPSLRSVSR
jgi:hypothetical protein